MNILHHNRTILGEFTPSSANIHILFRSHLMNCLNVTNCSHDILCTLMKLKVNFVKGRVRWVQRHCLLTAKSQLLDNGGRCPQQLLFLAAAEIRALERIEKADATEAFRSKIGGEHFPEAALLWFVCSIDYNTTRYSWEGSRCVPWRFSISSNVSFFQRRHFQPAGAPTNGWSEKNFPERLESKNGKGMEKMWKFQNSKMTKVSLWSVVRAKLQRN